MYFINDLNYCPHCKENITQQQFCFSWRTVDGIMPGQKAKFSDVILLDNLPLEDTDKGMVTLALQVLKKIKLRTKFETAYEKSEEIVVTEYVITCPECNEKIHAVDGEKKLLKYTWAVKGENCDLTLEYNTESDFDDLSPLVALLRNSGITDRKIKVTGFVAAEVPYSNSVSGSATAECLDEIIYSLEETGGPDFGTEGSTQYICIQSIENYL